MPPTSKENVRKRVGPLSKRLYILFVRLLKGGEMATISELQQAHFKFASPTRLAKLVKIQKSTIRRHGRRKAPYQKNILAQDAEGYVIDRFKTWASRMRLNGQEQLVYAATQKVILPKEEFPKLVMCLHNKGDTSGGKHRSFMKTLQLVKNTYSIGRRQFGISEFAIRKIVSSCPAEKCNSRLPDQGCHPGERLHLDSDESAGSSPSSDDQRQHGIALPQTLPPPGMPASPTSEPPPPPQPPPAHKEHSAKPKPMTDVVDLTIYEPLKKRLKRLASQDPNLNGQTSDVSTAFPVTCNEPVSLKVLPLTVQSLLPPNSRHNRPTPLTFNSSSDQPLNLTTRSGTAVSASRPMYLMVPIHSLDDHVDTLGGTRVATINVTQPALGSGGELSKLLLSHTRASISSSNSNKVAMIPTTAPSIISDIPPSVVNTTQLRASSVGYVEKWQEFWRMMRMMRPEIRHSYLLENKSTDRLNRMIGAAYESVRQGQRLLKEIMGNGSTAV